MQFVNKFSENATPFYKWEAIIFHHILLYLVSNFGINIYINKRESLLVCSSVTIFFTLETGDIQDTRYKIQDTRCIFRASEATLSGFSSEKGHEQVLLKSIKHMQVQYTN